MKGCAARLCDKDDEGEPTSIAVWSANVIPRRAHRGLLFATPPLETRKLEPLVWTAASRDGPPKRPCLPILVRIDTSAEGAITATLALHLQEQHAFVPSPRRSRCWLATEALPRCGWRTGPQPRPLCAHAFSGRHCAREEAPLFRARQASSTRQRVAASRLENGSWSDTHRSRDAFTHLLEPRITTPPPCDYRGKVRVSTWLLPGLGVAGFCRLGRHFDSPAASEKVPRRFGCALAAPTHARGHIGVRTLRRPHEGYREPLLFHESPGTTSSSEVVLAEHVRSHRGSSAPSRSCSRGARPRPDARAAKSISAGLRA